MKLTEELAKQRAAGAERIPAETMETMAGAVKQLVASGIAGNAPHEGSAAPSFSLPNAKGERVDVASLLADGPVVVSFYRGGWCPYCNLELRALQERLPEIEDLGAKLVAITPETPDNSLSTQEKNELGFEVLSDSGNAVARDFGLVFKVPDNLNDIYANQFGIDLEASNGDSSHELPIPATFVIGKDGEVIKAFVDPDHTKRLDPEEVLATLKSAKSQ